MIKLSRIYRENTSFAKTKKKKPFFSASLCLEIKKDRASRRASCYHVGYELIYGHKAKRYQADQLFWYYNRVHEYTRGSLFPTPAVTLSEFLYPVSLARSPPRTRSAPRSLKRYIKWQAWLARCLSLKRALQRSSARSKYRKVTTVLPHYSPINGREWQNVHRRNDLKGHIVYTRHTLPVYFIPQRCHATSRVSIQCVENRRKYRHRSNLVKLVRLSLLYPLHSKIYLGKWYLAVIHCTLLININTAVS